MSNMVHFTLKPGEKVRGKVEGREDYVFVGYQDSAHPFATVNTSDDPGHEKSFLLSREIIIDPELVGELEKRL